MLHAPGAGALASPTVPSPTIPRRVVSSMSPPSTPTGAPPPTSPSPSLTLAVASSSTPLPSLASTSPSHENGTEGRMDSNVTRENTGLSWTNDSSDVERRITPTLIQTADRVSHSTGASTAGSSGSSNNNNNSSGGSKGSDTQFPGKLHDMLSFMETEGYDWIAKWNDAGDSFVVYDTEKLVDILPKFFAQTKYRSFQRQLNMWSFQRLSTAGTKHAKVFKHPYFLKGRKDLCRKMSRHMFRSVNARRNARGTAPSAPGTTGHVDTSNTVAALPPAPPSPSISTSRTVVTVSSEDTMMSPIVARPATSSNVVPVLRTNDRSQVVGHNDNDVHAAGCAPISSNSSLSSAKVEESMEVDLALDGSFEEILAGITDQDTNSGTVVSASGAASVDGCSAAVATDSQYSRSCPHEDSTPKPVPLLQPDSRRSIRPAHLLPNGAEYWHGARGDRRSGNSHHDSCQASPSESSYRSHYHPQDPRRAYLPSKHERKLQQQQQDMRSREARDGDRVLFEGRCFYFIDTSKYQRARSYHRRHPQHAAWA